MPDQHVRSGYGRNAQQLLQVVGHLHAAAREVHRVAPAQAEPVIVHARGELRDEVVHVPVVQARHPATGQEHHGRTAGAGLVQPHRSARDLVSDPQRGLGHVRCVLHHAPALLPSGTGSAHQSKRS